MSIIDTLAPELTIASATDDDRDRRPRSQNRTQSPESKLNFAVIGGMFILNSALAKWIIYQDAPWIAATSAIIGSIILALPIFATAVIDLQHGRCRMNELVALAILAAAVAGMYQEAGVIAFFMLIAIAVEERTAVGARASIQELIKLTPKSCRRIDPESGGTDEIPVAWLAVNDVIRVRPGENFPVDGIVVSGVSTVNQASVTGESLPVDKEPQSEVFAGTANLTGVVDVTVTRIGDDTMLGKVGQLIEAAERSRLPVMRLIDQYIIYYTPTILMIAAILWFFTQDLLRVVLVLVIACPCALVVATPSAVVAAIAAAARLGILIKNVAHIESAARISCVIFDKTGTLTKGELEVARLAPARDVQPEDLLFTAASAESESNHPAAHAMRTLAKETRVDLKQPDKFQEFAGRGIEAHFPDGIYRVGRDDWFREKGLEVAGSIMEPLPGEQSETGALSIVYVARNDIILGWIGLRDAIRDSARPAIRELGSMGITRCGLVTGDREAVAKAVAKEVGISEIRADCLPEMKVDYVRDHQPDGVLFAGDGVNDAPALASADIGIAMGAAGSDVAINSASIALMNDDLRNIPLLIRLSRKTRRIVNANLMIGISIIVGGLVFFIFGNELLDAAATLIGVRSSVFKSVLAANIQIIGTLAVFFNSARLVRFGEHREKHSRESGLST